MKISYKLVSGGGYTVLCDDSNGAVVSEFPPSFQSEVQSDLLYDNSAMFRQPRGNVRASLPLDFLLTYDTPALALAGIRTIAGLLDTLLHLKVEQDSEVQYYPNAVITSYQSRPIGVSVIHNLQFTSDNVTATAQ